MAGKEKEQGKPQQAQTPGLGERFMGWVHDNRAQQPSFKAQVAAMFREAVKDIQNTFHQVMYGHPQQHGEPGTPLNPTPQQVTTALDGAPANDNRSDYERALDASAQQQTQERRQGRSL